MYQKLNESMENVIGYKLKGVFTNSEFEKMMNEIELATNKNNNIRLILEFEDLKETPQVLELVSDDRFGLKFHKKLSRFVCIAKPKWQRWWQKFTTLFTSSKTKFFTPKQRYEALSWVRQ